MHAAEFLQDLAIVMIFAALVTVAFRKLKQPVVLGYIVVGLIIGPHTPPFPLINDEATIHTLSELGVILLMFSLGLEFSLRKLKDVGVAALAAALTEILLLFWVGYEIGGFFGWASMDRVFLGAMLSMSSTTVIIKVLGELGLMKERFSQLVFGVLIIEDILGIAMIAVLSGLANSGELSVSDVGMTLGRLAIFLVVVLVVGLLLVPRLISFVARFKSNETLVIAVLGLCFGVSLLALKMGYSVALGAFIIGALVAESREIHRIEVMIEPVRDMFSAIFFVSIGLLIDPAMLVEHWQPIVVITLAVIVGKIVACSFGAFIGGNDTRTSVHVGMSLAQIGEFSFIIASLGATLGVTSGFIYPVAVAVSAITTLFTPYLIRGADGATSLFDRALPVRLRELLDLYTSWMGRVGTSDAGTAYRGLLWKWGAQVVLNATLIAAVFLCAAYLGANPPAWLVSAGLEGERLNVVLWLAAAVLSLPMFIVSARKLEAAGLLIAETKVREKDAGRATAAIRAVVATAVPLGGSVTLGVFVLLLSSTILPPLRVLVVLLAVVGFLAWRMWRGFARVYTLAQIAIEDTLSQKPEHETHDKPPVPLLAEANLRAVPVGDGSPAAGKLIRELSLRTKTGASIVCVERDGVRMVNPGPDEELSTGDRLLLIGDKASLDSAEKYLLVDGNTLPEPGGESAKHSAY